MVFLLIWTIGTSAFTMYQITYSDQYSQVTVENTKLNSELILSKLQTFDANITEKVTSAITLLNEIHTNASNSITKLDNNKTVIENNSTILSSKTTEILDLIDSNNSILTTTITDGFASLNTNIADAQSSIQLSIEPKGEEVKTLSTTNKDLLVADLDTAKTAITNDVSTKTNEIKDNITDMETTILAKLDEVS